MLGLIIDEMFISAAKHDKHVLMSCFASQAYLKSHFSYNPNTDNLIPCKEAGLAFSKGDILQVVNKEDSNWWQVRRCMLVLLKAQFGKKGIRCFLTTVLTFAQARKVIGGATGLIPSQFLEEKRKAFVRRDWDNSGAGQCTFVAPRSC